MTVAAPTRKEYEKITFSTPTPNVQRPSRQEYEKSLQPLQYSHGPGDEFLKSVKPEPQEQDPGISGAFDVWASPPDSAIWKSPGAEFTGEFGAGWLEQTRAPALAGKKFTPPKTTAGKIGRAAGQMSEAVTELIGLGSLMRGAGLTTTSLLKNSTKLEAAGMKALETGGLFVAHTATDEARKRTAEAIYNEDFGSRGGEVFLESFAMGAILSFASSGAGAIWSKLKPTEQSRALKTLGLKKGATLDEINAAARIQARKFHPDKVKGMRNSFDKVINARDTLRNMDAGNVIKAGSKRNFVNNIQQQMGVSKDVAQNALKRLEAGESIEQVDQMISQTKFGIKPLVTAPPEAIPETALTTTRQAYEEATVASPVAEVPAKGKSTKEAPIVDSGMIERPVAQPAEKGKAEKLAELIKAEKELGSTIEELEEELQPLRPGALKLLEEQGITQSDIDRVNSYNKAKLDKLKAIRDKDNEVMQVSAALDKAFADNDLDTITSIINDIKDRPEIAHAFAGKPPSITSRGQKLQYEEQFDLINTARHLEHNLRIRAAQPAEKGKVLDETISRDRNNIAAFLKDRKGDFGTSNRITYREMVDVIQKDKELSVDIEEKPIDPSRPLGETTKEYIVKLDGKKLRTIPKEVYDLAQPPQAPSEAIKKAIAPFQRAVAPKVEKARQGGFLSLPRTPSPEALREGAEKIYQNAINRFASIENTTKKAQKLGMEIKPGENPGLRARSYLGLGRKVESVLEDKTYEIMPEGTYKITGEGLKPILDDYDTAGKPFEKTRKKRKADLKTYLESQRTILDLQRPASDWSKQNIVSNEQVQKSKMDLERLKKKYGPAGMEVLEDSAQRLYEFQKRVLHTLVDGGNLSQKQYDGILSKNQHYIPFDRVLGDEMAGGVPVSKGRFTKARAPVKKIKGSEKEIHDPIESIIKNTFRIMEAADRNTVARNVAKLGKALPEDIRPIRVKMMPIKVDPKEILTISREFRTNSAKVMKEFRDIKTEGGKGADVSGPIKKLEKVVRESLTKRGYSEGEANSFINQIRKGESAETPEMTTETIRQVIKETQNVIISQEPVESTIFRPSQFAPKGKVIEYFDKGKRKYIEVSPNLYDAMTGLNEEGSSLVIKILSNPAHWLRIGATSTPEFVLRNPIRDQWTGLMQTSFGFIPFYDSMGAIADILGRTDLYYDWLRSGGAYSGFVELNRPSLKKAAKELTSTRARRMLARLNPIATMQDLSQLMEQATRVGMFKRAVKSGKTPIEAGFESREGTLDFQRRGAKMKDLNSMVAFLNAGIQGADKNVRTAYRHPISTAIKGFSAITLPSILLYLHNRKNKDYKEIPRWRKDLFWTYMREGKSPIHIIKPFFWGQLYGSLPERLMEYLATKDPKAFKDFGDTIIESLTPISGEPEGNLLPTALKPIMENWGNRNFFLERPIVPEGKKDLDAAYQYSRYTSESAKYMGEWLNYSPAKIENLISGWTGGSGRYGLQATDALINAIKKDEAPPARPKELADIPVVKAFVGRSPTGPQAQSIQDFYEDSGKVISAYDTYSQIYKDIIARKQQQDMLLELKEQRPLTTAEQQAVKPLTPQEKQEYAKSEKFKQANPGIIQGPIMKTTRELLSKLNKQAEAIIKMDIPDKEKRARLAKVDSMRLKVAQQANKQMK